MRFVHLLLGLLIIASAPAAAQTPFSASQASLAPGAHQVVINDVRLWYRVAGRPDGIPVVFLHGGPGQGSQSFAHFVGAQLERDHRMVYLDQRGAGRSERPWDDAYSIAGMVDDLEQLRSAWGVERIALVGHSFGTVLAMEYGARYPDRVSRMVLAAGVNDIQRAFDIQCIRLQTVDPAAYERAVAARREGSSARCHVMGAYPAEERERRFAANIFPDPATENILKAADEANGLRNTREVGAALFSQGLLAYRFTQAAALRMPVLVIGGTRDFQSVIELHREFVPTLPNGRLLEYEGAGHFMWVEQPDRFARDVTAFLNARN